MELNREQLLRQQASGRVFQEQFDNALQPLGCPGRCARAWRERRRISAQRTDQGEAPITR
jgi:hypothetical protein